MSSTEPRTPSAGLVGPIPTTATVFWRWFTPWQLWRFININLMMFRMIARSHPHKVPPSQE